MQVLNNPQGILFNPMSIASGLKAVMASRVYVPDDLFYLNETWNSWDFHSRFSHTSQDDALAGMNAAMAGAAVFLKEARWLLVTFGSAYQYFTTSFAGPAGYGVANCHKAPGNWFEKRLLSIEEMMIAWSELIILLREFNPALRIVFTVSPVRHIRDGLVANNRSKARLIELAHLLSQEQDSCAYFPAYELVTDVLRDYRFFEQDMVHPNNLATQYVWQQFVNAYMTQDDRALMQSLKEIDTAMQHRHRFPETAAALKFRERFWLKAKLLQEQYPYLDLQPELRFFAPGAPLL